jgi:hypothetical protein
VPKLERFSIEDPKVGCNHGLAARVRRKPIGECLVAAQLQLDCRLLIAF